MTESLGRSKDLTEGYRWPIFGLVVVYFALTSVLQYGLNPLLAALGASALAGPGGVTLSVLVDPIANVVGGVLGAVGSAVIYAQLRTAKEGAAVDELATVFD